MLVQVPTVWTMWVLLNLWVAEETFEHAFYRRVFPGLLFLKFFIFFLTLTTSIFILCRQSCLQNQLKLRWLLRWLRLHESFDIVFISLLNVYLFECLCSQAITTLNLLLHVSSVGLLYHSFIVSKLKSPLTLISDEKWDNIASLDYFCQSVKHNFEEIWVT